MHVAPNNFPPVNVAHTSKKVGQPCIKRKPNFSIINYSFNFCCSLKAKSILEVSKIYKGSLAYYLALNVDIIEVFLLAKPSWQILQVTKTQFQSQHYYFAKNMKAKMKIFIAQPLFS